MTATPPDPRRTSTSGADVVLHEERLRIGSARVATERLVLRKVIVTESRQVEVTVRREELHVERVAIAGGPPAGPAGGPDEPLVILLSEEVPEVRLRTRAYEQVTVHVDTVDGTEQVTEAVSHERVDHVVDVTAVAS